MTPTHPQLTFDQDGKANGASSAVLDAEVAFAERRKAEWLRDLDEQRRAKDQQRAFEKADKEIEDLREELQLQTLRSGADAALRSAMRAAKPG